MEPISEVIPKVFKNLDTKNDFKKIIVSLKKVLSSKETKHIHLSSFKKGVLRVNTDSPVLLYQLNLKKEQILKRIKEDWGADFIKGIIFRLGEINGASP